MTRLFNGCKALFQSGNDIVDMPNTDTCFFKDGGYHLDSVRIDLPDAIDTVMGGEEFTVEMHLHDVVSLATPSSTARATISRFSAE